MSFSAAYLAPVLASGLVSAIWQSALLALSVESCMRLLPGLSARLRSSLWLGALLLMLLLPVAALLPTRTPGSAPHLRVEPLWAMALVVGWAALSTLSAARLFRSAIHLRRVSGGAQRVLPAPDLARTLSASGVELCTSTEVDVPSVAGFFRPRILLPPGLLAELPPDDLRQIVLHEIEHLRRHDDWINLLQKLALVLFPLNPALMWAERRLCLERELACDDGVLRADGAGTVSAKAYATCLVNLAEHGLLRRGLSLALGAWRRPSELSRRVQRILRQAQQPAPQSAHPAALAVCLLTIIASTALSARAPQLISFSSAPADAVAQVTPASLPRSSSLPTSVSSVHPRLVKASMPQPSHLSAALVGVPRTRAQMPRRVHVRRLVRQPSAGVVLIGWQPDTRATGRAFYTRGAWTLTAYTTFTYAAVPTGSGWLVIQL